MPQNLADDDQKPDWNFSDLYKRIAAIGNSLAENVDVDLDDMHFLKIRIKAVSEKKSRVDRDDFMITRTEAKKFFPIRDLIAPPEDQPNFNEPSSDTNPDGVDIYLTVRQNMLRAQMEPTLIVEAKPVFALWQEKLMTGISSQINDQNLAQPNSTEFAAMVELGNELAESGLANVHGRTLDKSLEAAWVLENSAREKMDPMQSPYFDMLYESFREGLLKQAKSLKINGSADSVLLENNHQFAEESTILMTPEMVVRDQAALQNLVAEYQKIEQHSDPSFHQSVIAAYQQEIADIQHSIKDQWSYEKRQEKQKELESLEDQYRDIIYLEDVDNRKKTLDSLHNRIQNDSNIDPNTRSTLTERINFINQLSDHNFKENLKESLQQKIDNLDSEISSQLPITIINDKKIQIEAIKKKSQHEQQYGVAIIRDLILEENLFSQQIIQDRLDYPGKTANAIAQLQAKLSNPDDEIDPTAVGAEIAEKQSVLQMIVDRTEPEDIVENKPDARVGAIQNLMVGAGSIADGAFIAMMNAGLSKSTIQWGMGLMVEALQETPKHAPYHGFPIEGLKPADDIIPINRLGEIYTASRFLPWEPSKEEKNGNHFIDVDNALLNAIKVLSTDQGNEKDNQTRLYLGTLLLKNSFSIRRVVDQWVQDDHVPAFRDQRIDENSHMLMGYHVPLKDLLRAVEAVFTQGDTLNKITYNPDMLKKGADITQATQSVAVSPENIELMTESLRIGLRQAAANSIDADQSDQFNQVTPRYRRGEERLFLLNKPPILQVDVDLEKYRKGKKEKKHDIKPRLEP